MSYLLTESLADTVIVYLIIKKLAMPFEEWDAYKEGIIDHNGKKIKEPKTFKERKTWTFFDRFIANLKRIMQKFVGKSKFAAIATAVVLLKDSLVPVVGDLITEENTEHLTGAKQLDIKRIVDALAELPKLPSDIDDMKLEFYIERYLPLVESVLGDKWDEL